MQSLEWIIYFVFYWMISNSIVNNANQFLLHRPFQKCKLSFSTDASESLKLERLCFMIIKTSFIIPKKKDISTLVLFYLNGRGLKTTQTLYFSLVNIHWSM